MFWLKFGLDRNTGIDNSVIGNWQSWHYVWAEWAWFVSEKAEGLGWIISAYLREFLTKYKNKRITKTMRFIMIILYYILKYFIVQIFIHLHTRPEEELTVSRFFAKYKKNQN